MIMFFTSRLSRYIRKPTQGPVSLKIYMFTSLRYAIKIWTEKFYNASLSVSLSVSLSARVCLTVSLSESLSTNLTVSLSAKV